MSVKQVEVRVPGGDVSARVAVTPEMTAGEALRQVGLSTDFFLSPATGGGYFQADEKLDPVVQDGAVLHANPWADVGEFDLSQLTAEQVVAIAAGGVVVFILLIVLLCAACSKSSPRRARRASVPRGAGGGQATVAEHGDPLLKRLGWASSGDHHSGHYRVGNGFLQGDVVFRSQWDNDFQLLAPPGLIAACREHAGCFIPRTKPDSNGQRWFGVHFRHRPVSAAAGVVAIQRVLEAGARRWVGDVA